MSSSSLQQFLADHRDDLIIRCREKVAKRVIPPAPLASIEHGVPVFLDQLTEVLRLHLVDSPLITRTAVLHGRDLLEQGYSVGDVVHDYGDVCQSVTELALDLGLDIHTDDFRVLNRCLDNAIAGAVAAYGQEPQGTKDLTNAASAEATQVLVSDLRTLAATATAAFTAIKSGRVGANGSTGAVLDGSLKRMRTRIDQWVSTVGGADATPPVE